VLVFRHLTVFFLVVIPRLRFISLYRVGSLYQVIPEIAVPETNPVRLLRLEGVFHALGKAVERASSFLDALGYPFRIREPVSAFILGLIGQIGDVLQAVYLQQQLQDGNRTPSCPALW
jgi:hypothetical protein